MAKLNELVYSVRESLKEFSDDSEIDDRYIIHLYNIKRAKYLRQDLNNFQKTSDLSIQQKFCMELIEISADECNLELTCDKLLKTKKPLPKAIELHTKVAITEIKPASKIAAKFNLININRVPLVKDTVFPNAIYAFIDTDNHIYITSKTDSYKLIECITVAGIFENPLELSDYATCCGCDDAKVCFDESETEYPLQPHYIDIIKSEIVNELLGAKRFPEDKENDANDLTYGQK